MGSAPWLGSTIGAAVPDTRHDPRVELDWLRTFLAVLDRGGFSAAAEQVHRSQSRVSAHIAALERKLGVTLIDRSRRPARVTPAGEILAERARDILAAVGSARSAVGAARGLHEGRVTLLTTPCVGSTFLAVAAISFSQLFAHAREQLIRSNIPREEMPLYMNVFRLFFALAWTVGPAAASWVMIEDRAPVVAIPRPPRRSLLRRRACKIRGIIDASATVVARDLRIWAEWPCPNRFSVDALGRLDPLRSFAPLNPSFERA